MSNYKINKEISKNPIYSSSSSSSIVVVVVVVVVVVPLPPPQVDDSESKIEEAEEALGTPRGVFFSQNPLS